METCYQCAGFDRVGDFDDSTHETILCKNCKRPYMKKRKPPVDKPNPDTKEQFPDLFVASLSRVSLAPLKMVDDRPEIEKELHRLGIQAERAGVPEAEIKRIKFLIWCLEARDRAGEYLSSLEPHKRESLEPDALLAELIAVEVQKKLMGVSCLHCKKKNCICKHL